MTSPVSPKRSFSISSGSSSSSKRTTGSNFVSLFLPSSSSTSSPSSVAEITEIDELRKIIQELTIKNEKLTIDLEEVKEELNAERQEGQLLLERILFQNKLIQSREELIHAQKE